MTALLEAIELRKRYGDFTALDGVSLAIAEGELGLVTDVVPEVTGHPALTVAEHLRRHPEDWAHLAR